MAVINILNIINTTNVKQKVIEIDNGINNVDTKLSTSFLDSIRKGTQRLENTNCADNIVNNTIHKVGDFFDENLRIKNIVKNVGIVGDFGKIDNKLVGFICHIINSNFKTLITIIESLLKILLALLRKIEKLKTKVQKAILDFSKELRNCFIRIVLDAKFGMEKLVRTSMDFSGLTNIIKQCPCLIELLQEKFPICKNLTTAEEVVYCLENEYRLSPNNIINSLNDWTKNHITDPIHNGFNIIDEAVQNILESIIFPFRELVKRYCKELNRKHNMDLILAKDSSIRCLFVYSEEYDSKGNKFFGMSVIDMLNTMKKWTTCVDTVCSTLHNDIRRKIQDYNEKLKLDYKFWSDEITLDIYFACIATDVEREFIRPTAIREIYTKNKGKGVFTSLLDFYKDIGKLTVEAADVEDPKTLGDAVKKVLGENNTGDDIGLGTHSGPKQFKNQVEKTIIKILLNLGQEINEDYYQRKVIEMGVWDFNFKKDQEYIDTKEKIANGFQTKYARVSTKAEITSVSTNTSSRAKDSEYYKSPTVPVATYAVPEDYIEVIVPSKPIPILGETAEGLYKRWYASI